MHNAVSEVAKASQENVQRVGQDVGSRGGFDVPGEASTFRAKDLGKGEMGRPGSSFDGPWDQTRQTMDPPRKQHEGAETVTQSPPPCDTDYRNNICEVEHPQSLDSSVKSYNEELAQKSAGGEYNDVRVEDLKRTIPEEVAKNRKEFNQNRGELVDQWEIKNGREWPTYDKDALSKEGKIIRKAGDRYDAHHVQPLGLGGKNTVENITPMHAKDHYDKQGIHRPGGAYDDMVRNVKEA